MKLIILITLLITGSTAYAAVPYEFFPDQAAKAAEVNANFSDLDSRVKKNKDDITLINSDITVINSDLEVLESDVTAVESDVTAVEEEISTLSTSLTDTSEVVDATVDTVIDLDDRLTILENASVEGNGCASKPAPLYLDYITYSHQSVAAGTVVSLFGGTNDSVIRKFPVYDYTTGKKYILTMPVITQVNSNSRGVFIVKENLDEIEAAKGCFDDFKLNGYSAFLIDQTKFSFTKEEYYAWTSFSALVIKIGGVYLTIPVYSDEDADGWGDGLYATYSAPLPVDASNVAEFNQSADLTVYSKVNTWLNYIKIEEVE